MYGTRDTPWYRGTRGIIWYTHPGILYGIGVSGVLYGTHTPPPWSVDTRMSLPICTLCPFGRSIGRCAMSNGNVHTYMGGGIHCEQWQCTHMIQPCARLRLQYLFTPFSSRTTKPVSLNKNNQQFFKTYKEERSLLVYIPPFNGDCIYYS